MSAADPEAFKVADKAAAKRVPRQRRRRAAVEDRSVRADVWRLALQLADGDHSRIVVEGRESVLVVNRARP